MTQLFNFQHVESMLNPMKDLKFRFRAKKNSEFPIILENSVENSFKIELTSIGISFLLSNDFYINKSLEKLLNEALIAVDIYPYQLNKLLKIPESDDSMVFTNIKKHVQMNLQVQIGFTYYTMINSLEINNRGFSLNGHEFIIYK